MFKIMFTTFLLPVSLCALCRDCDFPYRYYLHEYKKYYENTSFSYSEENITETRIDTDRERAIFYSGCAFSLEQIMMMEEKF